MSRKTKKRKIMKVMSIIGIVWFSLSLICIIAFFESDIEASSGWGMLGMLYAIPYSIVGLILSNRKKQTEKSTIIQLIELSELKEKGILSEDEFQAMKKDLLMM
jgi:surface polysaccharide O-acyltransferase-like enzyme